MRGQTHDGIPDPANVPSKEIPGSAQQHTTLPIKSRGLGILVLAGLLLATILVVVGTLRHCSSGASSSSAPATRAALLREEIPSVAANLVEQAGCTGEVSLDLELDTAPVLLQFMLSSGIISHNHVLPLSVLKVGAEALGLEQQLVTSDKNVNMEPLKVLGRALRSEGGARSVCLMRGQGLAADNFTIGEGLPGDSRVRAGLSPESYMSKRNFGFFSDSQIKRSNCPPSKEGIQCHELLNVLEAGARIQSSCRYHPSLGKVSLAGCAKLDGLMTAKGCAVFEYAGVREVWGFKSALTPQEAQQVWDMHERGDDVGFNQFLASHEFVTEAVELMFSMGDDSMTGNLGYFWGTKGGTAKELANELNPMLLQLRTCYGCAHEAFTKGKSITEAAASCDLTCASCADGDCTEHGGEHYSVRRCSCCKQSGRPCVSLYPVALAFDQCGEQAGLLGAVSTYKNRVENGEVDPDCEISGAILDMEVLSDAIHDIKNMVCSSSNNRCWADEHMWGTFALWSRFYDADPDVRVPVRRELTRRALRGKDKFNIQQKVELFGEKLQQNLLSKKEQV